MKKLLFILALSLAAPALAGQPRSEAVKTAFANAQACPANARNTKSCEGYWIDHKKPLDCGGADSVDNMQWLTIAAAMQKAKWERTNPACKNPTKTPRPE